MSDPIRWRNDPSSPGSVRDLLQQARATPSMPPDVGASIAAELAKLGPPPPPPPAASLFASKAALKTVAGLTLAGAATWGGLKLFESKPTPAPAPVVEVAPPAPSPVVEAPKPVATPDPVKPVIAPPAAPAKKAVAVDSLKEESNLVEQARAQLFEKNPAEAMKLLDKHLRRFPHGQHEVEREFLAIRTLGLLGRTEERNRRAEVFLKRFESSPYYENVRKSVQEQ